jgi:hypothetical protein
MLLLYANLLLQSIVYFSSHIHLFKSQLRHGDVHRQRFDGKIHQIGLHNEESKSSG